MKTPGTVLITGASSGIGRAIALHLDRIGWKVFAGVRKTADAEALSKEASDRLTAPILDVTDPAAIERVVREIEVDVGELDALVNNAGISVTGALEFIPLEELRRQFEVNFFGVVAMTQAALPLIRKSGGRIVHIGSIGGREATPIVGPYSASKFAIEAIAEAQRRELAPWGIEVVVIEPGAIATEIWAKGQAAADRTIEAASPRELELYGAAFDVMRAAATDSERRAVGPEAVADAVEDALTRARPKARYLVGSDAKLLAFMTRFLPDRIRDALVLRLIKYPRRA